MANLNKVFLMGRLTFDPELRRTPSGTAVTELRMAINRGWKGQDGERKEETLFIDVTVWDRRAETCCQYLKKGSNVHVEGTLKMDTWDDKTTGEKRSKIKVVADHVEFLDRPDPGGSSHDESGSVPARRAGSAGGYGEPRGATYGAPRSAPSPVARRASVEPAPEEDGDDIPF